MNLDLLFFIIVVRISPIAYITPNGNTNVVLSTDFPDMSIVAIKTIPMSVVAVPVSVSYAVVDEGSVFIFTELADELRLQGCKSKTKRQSSLLLSNRRTHENSRRIFSMTSGKVQQPSTCHLEEC